MIEPNLPTMRSLIESITAFDGAEDLVVSESLDESDVRVTYNSIRNQEITCEDFIDWVYEIRAAAKREVE